MRAALRDRSRVELELAAAVLAVLRPELYATVSGRREFDGLVAEYDDVEAELAGR